jgi:hypothetical protein
LQSVDTEIECAERMVQEEVSEMKAKDENEVWDWIDKLILSKSNENESITSGWSTEDYNRETVRISYSCITDHKLYQRTFLIPMCVLQSISVDSIDAILTDIITTYRQEYE